MNDVQLQGWYADPDSGGTRFWDGAAWTGDRRPERRPFAASAAHRGWGIGLLCFGVLVLLTSPAQFGQTQSSAPPIVAFLFAVVLGCGLIAAGVYLSRGQGPTTKSVLTRLSEQRPAQPPRPAPAPPSPASASNITINLAHGESDSASAAQIRAISNPETAAALQNLQKLLYTRVITDEEFQAAKDKLLGNS